MSLEKTTELYASVLHQLLPEGVHDSAQQTLVADDIYAHAKILAQSDIDAHRLLKVLEEVPLELLPDYEQEYGLPMLCAVPGSFSIEERLNALKLVRTRRNVFNRTYLQQILAVFGVTLIDVVKFKPMQCTAPCTSPVNTERLRYKVLLRLQYPMTADMGCIIENYLPGYLRIDWTIDMPWGVWILNAGVTVNTSGIAHYTAYKTNQREYYDSYANIDLTDALIRSFHDPDMQQWQGFKDAVNELTGVANWVVDAANERIVKTTTVPQYLYSHTVNQVRIWRDTPTGACVAQITEQRPNDAANFRNLTGFWGDHNYTNGCWAEYKASYETTFSAFSFRYGLTRQINPNYDANNSNNYTYYSFSIVAQKIISNLQSSNQGISLLAEAYVETVARSIFAADESKQFVKLSNLIGQFEANKTLRT